MNRKLIPALASLVLMYSATAWSQEATMATINGQDEYQLSGYIECGGEATSTIKPGERFIARELSHGEGYWEVYLKSGISGNIPRNRIRLLPDEPLAKLNYESCKKEWRKLQSKPIKNTDVVAYSAKKYHGVANYYKTLLQASEGDAKAFAQFDSLSHMDGEAGEGHEETTWVLLHVAGDDTFAKLLAGQSSNVREGYAEFFADFGTAFFSIPKAYIKLHFPKTYAILYGNAAQQTKADQKPIEEVKARAEAGDAESEVELGLRYTNGEGVAKDQVEAVKWFRKAAEQNLARAQKNLGICYDKGEGVAKDQVEAVKWFRKAAEQNYADAQNDLGASFYNGEGVAKDQVEAVKWFRKAAEQNFAPAQYNLNVCYYNGKGVAKDYVEAYEWLLLAARQGDEDAKKNITELERKLTPEQLADGKTRARDFMPR
jgi:hypothetical protein